MIGCVARGGGTCALLDPPWRGSESIQRHQSELIHPRGGRRWGRPHHDRRGHRSARGQQFDRRHSAGKALPVADWAASPSDAWAIDDDWRGTGVGLVRVTGCG